MAELLHGLSDGIDDPKAGGFSAAQGTSTAQRFAGDHPGGILSNQPGIFIHHPAHHLRGGAHIGGRYVLARADITPQAVDEPAAQPFLFGCRKGGRVHHHAAFTSPQRDIGYRAFPGHPGCQGADRVQGLGRVETDAAFIRAAGVVMLHAVAIEDPDRAIVHTDRDADMEFPHRPAQEFGYLGIQS